MTVKTILFDFGGVIIKTPNLKRLKRLKSLFGSGSHPDVDAMLSNPNESQLVQDICLGKITEDQLWLLMAEKWHVNPRLMRRVKRCLFSKRSLNKPLVKFIGELQENYQTAILSNAGDQTRRVMEERLGLDRYVEEIIISAEEGVIKPDHRIFQIAMDRLNASPETSLFIDDYRVNVEAARDFGMNAVQFINNHQVIQAVRDYLKEG